MSQLQNGISIGSAVFAQLTSMPNTQTDRQTTASCNICSNRPHLMHSVQAMRPNDTNVIQRKRLK